MNQTIKLLLENIPEGTPYRKKMEEKTAKILEERFGPLTDIDHYEELRRGFFSFFEVISEGIKKREPGVRKVHDKLKNGKPGAAFLLDLRTNEPQKYNYYLYTYLCHANFFLIKYHVKHKENHAEFYSTMKEAHSIFSNGLNSDNLTTLEIWLTSRLKKLK